MFKNKNNILAKLYDEGHLTAIEVMAVKQHAPLEFKVISKLDKEKRISGKELILLLGD